MIAFDLQCENGHVFEGWFENGAAFEAQKKKGLVTCPTCDTISLSKIPTSFGIKKSTPSSNGMQIDEQAILANIGRKIVDFVEKNFDDVGTDFTKEALKIHYGVEEPRNIRGVSSEEEEKVLQEEGVEFVKLPIPEEKTESDN
jgi:hypothetical protein